MIACGGGFLRGAWCFSGLALLTLLAGFGGSLVVERLCSGWWAARERSW